MTKIFGFGLKLGGNFKVPKGTFNFQKNNKPLAFIKILMYIIGVLKL